MPDFVKLGRRGYRGKQETFLLAGYGLSCFTFTWHGNRNYEPDKRFPGWKDHSRDSRQTRTDDVRNKHAEVQGPVVEGRAEAVPLAEVGVPPRPPYGVRRLVAAFILAAVLGRESPLLPNLFTGPKESDD